LLQILLPVFLGYLGSATTFLVKTAGKSDDSGGVIQGPLFQLLIRWPIFVSSFVLIAILGVWILEPPGRIGGIRYEHRYIVVCFFCNAWSASSNDGRSAQRGVSSRRPEMIRITIALMFLVVLCTGIQAQSVQPASDLESFDQGEDDYPCIFASGSSKSCDFLGNLDVNDFEKNYAAALQAARSRENRAHVVCVTPGGAVPHPCVRQEDSRMIYHWSIPPFPLAPRKGHDGSVMTFHPQLGMLLTDWVPVSSAAGGEQFLKEVEHRARARESFDCVRASCLSLNNSRI